MINFIKNTFATFIGISLLVWMACEIHFLSQAMRRNLNAQNVIWLADAKECPNEV